MNNLSSTKLTDGIAIIGLAGRFPGAHNVAEFWQNVKNGVESISFLSDQELLAEGIDPAILADPSYIKAKGVLANIAEFDAALFGFSPREAEITDPQQRLFLECAWEALETAGYNPKTYPGNIGVYGGVTGGNETYFFKNLYPNHEVRKTIGDYQLVLSNEKDFLCTRVAYKLNLRGPAVTVQTACSTSLVAVVLGCQSLLNYQCEMVLAGGASITPPQKTGYFYKEGMILSPDGHCRAFDAKAQGTVDGNGVGMVVLKRLEDAINEGDSIYAVIRGAAINNDGFSKIGFTAPSVEGQMRVIIEALALADVSAETVTYVETHGTSTPLGDPIEITALTKAFRTQTDKTGYCAIGSVKTNVGHLDVAAGVTGLIKTVLALQHRLLPPSLNFDTPNPHIDFANSPFYVNTRLTEWDTEGLPRRAGVSCFGMGGTNAHLLLEEAPPRESAGETSRPWQLLVLSAKTAAALETVTSQLLEHLQQHPHLNWADVAYTYQVGRQALNQRRMLVCQTLEEAVQILAIRDSPRILTQATVLNRPQVVLMFSGQGAQYVNMGWELYQTEPRFREKVNYCAEFLKPHLGIDLRVVLYPSPHPRPLSQGERGDEESDLNQTFLTQPALFVIEYALASLWMSWGLQPTAMIGHSIGEYVAACLAGVFTLEEALVLVAARGRLMQSVPPGTMLAVPLAEEELRPLLTPHVELATINVPSQSVVAGPPEAIAQFAAQLANTGVECQLLHTSHAFHSDMMSPILPAFLAAVAKVSLQPPRLPYLSNLTGTWITATQATDPHYWGQHLRHTVRFAAGLQEVLTDPKTILLEVGPGKTLSTFAKRHPAKLPQQVVLSTLRHPKDEQSDGAFLLTTLGQLWLAGVTIDWSAFHAQERRYRLPLPTYPFERRRYWIEPVKLSSLEDSAKADSLSPEDHQPLPPSGEPTDSVPRHSRAHLSTTYLAPRNPLEQTLTAIWQEFFNIEPIGIQDDFFELGGDSLLIVQLATQLRKVLQVPSLAAHHLLTTPTIATLAAAIAQLTVANKVQVTLPFSLVELQAGNPQRTPLFLVHPAEGQIYVYRDLARCLGPEQPVYGLQAAGLEKHTDPVASIEAMASDYIKALQVRQPLGPYLLGGSSFGGTCALEMAQQLLATGQKVALLTLIDTPRLDNQGISAAILGDDLNLLATLLRMSDDFAISLDEIRTLPQEKQLPAYLEHYAKISKKTFPLTALEDIRYLLCLFRTNYQSMVDYQPQPYPGHIVFFSATDRDETNPPHPERGWLELATGGIEVYEVPGNHVTMNHSPHVEVMAKQLQKYFQLT